MPGHRHVTAKAPPGPAAVVTAAVRVMIGVPSFGAQLYAATAMALVNAVSARPDLEVTTFASPLLCFARNSLFHDAVTRARNGELTHLVFLDADVAPIAPDWLERLLQEADAHQAPVLGAVVPIKNATGDLGCARETEDPWHPRNLHRAELARLPTTWTEPGLLVTTGCLLVDVRQEWCEQIVFTIADRVTRTGDAFEAAAKPEDWDFSRQARAHGVPIFATQAIALQHWGPSWW